MPRPAASTANVNTLTLRVVPTNKDLGAASQGQTDSCVSLLCVAVAATSEFHTVVESKGATESLRHDPHEMSRDEVL